MELVSLPSIHLETKPIRIRLLLAVEDRDHLCFWNCAQSLGHFRSRSPVVIAKGNGGSFELSTTWQSLYLGTSSVIRSSIVPSGSGLVNAGLLVMVYIEDRGRHKQISEPVHNILEPLALEDET